MRSPNQTATYCPDCGRPLQTVWDYPANELWCVQCGNRYFAAFGPRPGGPGRAVQRSGEGAGESGMSDPLIGFRVLLLDGTDQRRDDLATHLTRLGYQVTPVCHPRQALEAASFRRFDIALVSSALAEFDCLTFVGKLKLLLGGVKFVVFADSRPTVEGRGEVDGRGEVISVPDPSVVWARWDAVDLRHLEQVLERLIDESLDSQALETRTSEARTPEADAGTSEKELLGIS